LPGAAGRVDCYSSGADVSGYATALEKASHPD
jgi:hypothetical protein